MVDNIQVGIEAVTKSFGGFQALTSIDLTIPSGEILALLGPSGCGKTTLLRCIAGLEAPTSGRIEISGRTVFSADGGVNEPPERRRIGLVFQSYALWPHLTVGENVAYGLKLRRVGKSEAEDRVTRILDRVGLSGFADRYPSTLSGGQQQRVALARSLVVEAEVILFDEPLSNLDLKLREEMRFELRNLINRIGVTAIFVTHDQSEAMVLADRICLMRSGEIIQSGSPRDVYSEPQSRFAMDFLGSANFLEASGNAGVWTLASGQILRSRDTDDSAELIGIRPENLAFVGAEVDAESENVLRGVVKDAVFLGPYTIYVVDIGKDTLSVNSVASDVEVGDAVAMKISPNHVRCLRS